MSEMLTRRRLLINGGLAGLVLAGTRVDAFALQEDLWATAATILGRIKAPVFPARDVPITSHGARGDGTTDCTAAFREAIEACRAAGGGRVVVPAGRFLTGAIRLRSNVNLHLDEGATIAFRPEASAYLPLVLTRFEGHRADELLPVHLRARRDQRRDHRPRHARRAGRRAALVGRGARARRRPEPAHRHGREGRAGGRAGVRRGHVAAAGEFRPAVPVPERPHRGRDDHQLADVGAEPRPLHQRHRPRRERSRATAPTTTAAIPSRAATC